MKGKKTTTLLHSTQFDIPEADTVFSKASEDLTYNSFVNAGHIPLFISIKPFDLILYDSKTTCSSGVIRSVNKVAITPTKKIITKTIDVVNLRKKVIEDIAKRCKYSGAIVPTKRPKKNPQETSIIRALEYRIYKNNIFYIKELTTVNRKTNEKCTWTLSQDRKMVLSKVGNVFTVRELNGSFIIMDPIKSFGAAGNMAATVCTMMPKQTRTNKFVCSMTV